MRYKTAGRPKLGAKKKQTITFRLSPENIGWLKQQDESASKIVGKLIDKQRSKK